MDPSPLITPSALAFFERVLGPIRRYHRWSLTGGENIPREGGALLVMHHSLATYDGLLMGKAVYDETGRLPTALGDDMLFRAPGMADMIRAAGIRPASPTAGMELLAEGHLLFVAPGGMWESLRPSRESRSVRWEGRRGFCRLALKAQVPIILCACPAADDIYRVRASSVTNRVYKRFKAPMPLARGIGPTLVPRRIKLTHHVAEPLQPPPYEPNREEEQVDALYTAALERMRALLQRD
mgnify:CR=1 FL=1